MTNTDRLFEFDDALAFNNEVQECFVSSCREMFAFHSTNSPIIAAFAREMKVRPDMIRSLEDLSKIPYVLVTAFKYHRLLSIPESEIVRTFTSSGTTGQSSQINWDAISAERQSHMRSAIVETYGLKSEKTVNYLCFSYSRDVAKKRGAALAHEAYSTFAPAAEKFFALHADEHNNVTFDVNECIEALGRYADSGLPLRITGFPAFLWRTLGEIEKQGIRFNFPESSVIFNGGGWKTVSQEKIPIEVYRQKIEDLLGVPSSRLRDVYGMVEHGVPYMTCEHGNYHVPIYSRVFARDPANLEPLPRGEKGLLNLVTPYIRSTPALSVLSTDWGIVKSDCPCNRGDYLILKGRAGTAKHKGCAISASELLMETQSV